MVSNYTVCRHTHYGISQRQHMFRVFAIHSECARLHNLFFFMMDYGENGYLVIIGGGGEGLE